MCRLDDDGRQIIIDQIEGSYCLRSILTGLVLGLINDIYMRLFLPPNTHAHTHTAFWRLLGISACSSTRPTETIVPECSTPSTNVKDDPISCSLLWPYEFVFYSSHFDPLLFDSFCEINQREMMCISGWLF
jgi:hypothetical protein